MQANVRYPTFAESIAPPMGLQRAAVMAALVTAGSIFTALCAQFTIVLPFTPVPITGQTFAVLAVGGLLGSRLGATSLLLYMAWGSVGLLWGSQADGFKVFANGANGWEVIAGPTGGYIVGFIAAAYVVGWLAERGFDRRPWSMALAMAVGNVVIYVFGLPWLDHFYPGQALELGLYPFVAGDAAKLLLAASLLPIGRWALARIPGVEEAVPQSQEGLVLGRYLPMQIIYGSLAALMLLGTLLPWGVPGGGGDMGLGERSGQVALAAGLASLLALAAPRLGLYLIVGALALVGLLLPFGVLPDYRLNVDQTGGLAALSVGLLALLLLSGLALPRLPRREAMRTAQFIVGALAGFAAFYHIVQILTAAESFTLTDLRAGLPLSALAAVLLAATAIAEQQEGPAQG